MLPLVQLHYRGKMFKLKYFWPYLLFAGTIVFLVTANRIHIKEEINRNLIYTKTLNISGRQRMLSQKLAKLSYQSLEGKEVKDEMLSSIGLWKQWHENLKNSQQGVSIHSYTHPEIAEMFEDLSMPFEALVKDYQNVADSGASQALIASIDELEPIFLSKMHAIVNELEANAKEDLDASREKQMLLALVSGIVLLLEMLIFVYPYHKRLIRAYKKVLRQQEELEENTKTIAHLYETNELIIKGTNAGIWEWDIITGEEQWSDRFFHLLGYERGDVPATYDSFLNILLHPEDKDKIQRAVDEHLKNKTPYKHDIRMLNKSGDYKWYETSGQAIWEDGNAIRMAGSIIDITDRMSARKKMLEQSETKDKILSIVAHDLRSPVNNLKSMLELLKEHVINKEEFLEHLSVVSKNVDSMSESMDNLLTWAQTQAKGGEVHPTEFKLEDAVTECIRLYRGSIEAKHIELDYHSNELFSVYADFNQMVLIIRNILNNAIKFTPEEGKIVIDLIDKGDYASVVITDTGEGMDAETIDKVLNKNKIISTRGTNGEKGTGLGMNMSLEFSARNNCKFDMFSQPNVGTTVSLSIPKVGTGS